jgi:GNAT superfamily N-acetyltransferase
VAALAVLPFFERPGRWGRVVALVVDERARGLGVGRRLLAATEQAAVARGCVRMEITSSRRRTGAHAFYRSLGYADRCEDSARFLKDLITGQ